MITRLAVFGALIDVAAGAATAAGATTPPGVPQASCVVERGSAQPGQQGPEGTTDTATRTIWLPGRWGNFALSPDGKLVATIDDADAVTFWDVATCKGRNGAPTGEKPPKPDTWHGGSRSRLFFGQDGAILFAERGAWRVATGELLARLPGPPAKFSPDGSVLLLETKARLLPWSVRSWTSLGAPLEVEHRSWFSNVPGNAYLAAFSADSRLLAVATKDRVLLWNVTKAQADATMLRQPHEVLDVAFSPKGDLLATVGSQELLLWSVASGERVAKLEHRGSGLGRKLYGSSSDVTFSPDGRYLVWRAGEGPLPDGELFVWDTLATPNGTLAFHASWKYSPPRVTFSADGTKMEVAGLGDRLALFDLSRNPIGEPVLVDAPAVVDPALKSSESVLAAPSATALHDGVFGKDSRVAASSTTTKHGMLVVVWPGGSP
jgi:WD40 repeat protein